MFTVPDPILTAEVEYRRQQLAQLAAPSRVRRPRSSTGRPGRRRTRRLVQRLRALAPRPAHRDDLAARTLACC